MPNAVNKPVGFAGFKLSLLSCDHHEMEHDLSQLPHGLARGCPGASVIFYFLRCISDSVLAVQSLLATASVHNLILEIALGARMEYARKYKS